MFNTRGTLIYCDMAECKHIKKHKLYWGKPSPEQGEKYIDVCGRKYLSLFFAHVEPFHDTPPVVCTGYEVVVERKIALELKGFRKLRERETITIGGKDGKQSESLAL